MQPTTHAKKNNLNPLVNEEQQKEISDAPNNKPNVATLVRKETIALSRFHRWTPQDDLLLKNAVERGLRENEIQKQVKFSFKFSQDDIKERWKSLLYDVGVSELAAKHMVILSNVNSKRVPWTEEENKMILDELKRRKFISFQHFIDSNRERLHPTRTVKSLEAHFYRLKRSGTFDGIDHYHGLSTKKDDGVSAVESLTDAEKEVMNTNEIAKQARAPSRTNPNTSTKQSKAQEKKEAKQIVKLEKSHSISNSLKPPSKKRPRPSESEEEDQTDDNDSLPLLAVLEGEKCKFEIRTQTTILGRKNKHLPVDCDLSLEGNAGKVSRQQASITLQTATRKEQLAGISTGKQTSGDEERRIGVSVVTEDITVPVWSIQNLGKRDLLVNGQQVVGNASCELVHNAIVVFPGDLKFMFTIDQIQCEKWILQ
ncbi:microspherule protein 1 [Acrasis kona]|uniref:Microspherule protein 1 n=1 Tax=Acrasis kona TaxID=1008807 RepID=A0AAW2YTG2_9EUKA